MGRPLYPKGARLPDTFLEALSSERAHTEVAEELGVAPAAVRYRRAALFPGRAWEPAATKPKGRKATLAEIRRTLPTLDREALVELQQALEALLKTSEVHS